MRDCSSKGKSGVKTRTEGFSRREVIKSATAALALWGVSGRNVRAQSIANRATGANARLGINLSEQQDWTTEIPFSNLFRRARPWISQRSGADWGGGPPLALDENGWITKLERGCWATTHLCQSMAGHYPSGEYTVTYDGEGELEFSSNVFVERSEPGRMLLDVVAQRGDFTLSLVRTDADNPLRNIRVLLPGADPDSADEQFAQAFLDRWHGMSCLRFMDWMQTNNSEIVSWSDRPKMSDASFSPRGVPVEAMIELANRNDADPWFCMPHRADDDYVRNFARVVRDNLKPGLRAWVEYSNETWNSVFNQYDYAGERGQQLGFASKPWEAAWLYTAHRSRQVFGIWEEVFGGTDDFVRVIASQAGVPWISEQILAHEDAYQSADVLAVAPYITCMVSQSDEYGLQESEFENWSLSRVLNYMSKEALPEAIQLIREQKDVADRFGVKLVAYEAGQHMTGTGGAENNDSVTQLFLDANNDPRMHDIYARYYQAWTEAGGDLICHYNSVEGWSKWGSWGLFQYEDEDPNSSAKYRASIEWARSRGQEIGTVAQ